ncbi:MAG: FAD-dependent thymidylate synthase [Patescibacteria group bacterium]
MPTEYDRQPEGLPTDFPFLPSPQFQTPAGTPYLRAPGVHLISRPEVNLGSVSEFLGGFDQALGFEQYLDDPTILPSGAQICKFAGQTCYMSFGPKRTMNADAQKYLENIITSGHGSVLEHANYSFLLYGISRSMTHELVRHRAGFGYSQLSQRYVSGKVLRFVERPEYADDAELHLMFVERIDWVAAKYEALAKKLIGRQKAGETILSAEQKTDLRKKVNQAARSLLPNETEAPIVVTGNARAWRHVIEMRASEHAETEIRLLAWRIFLCLRAIEPLIFDDYEGLNLPDGTKAVKTEFRKV